MMTRKQFDLDDERYIGSWIEEQRPPSYDEFAMTLDTLFARPDEFDFTIEDVYDAYGELTGIVSEA